MDDQKSYTVRTETGEIQLMSQEQVAKMVRSSIERSKTTGPSPRTKKPAKDSSGANVGPGSPLSMYSASTATSRRIASPRNVPNPLSPRSRFNFTNTVNPSDKAKILGKNDSTAKLFKNFQEAINTGGSFNSSVTQKANNSSPPQRRAMRESRGDKSSSLRGSTIDERFAAMVKSTSPKAAIAAAIAGVAVNPHVEEQLEQPPQLRKQQQQQKQQHPQQQQDNDRSFAVHTQKSGKKNMSETEINDLVRNSIKRARQNAKKKSRKELESSYNTVSNAVMNDRTMSPVRMPRKFSWSSVEESVVEEELDFRKSPPTTTTTSPSRAKLPPTDMDKQSSPTKERKERTGSQERGKKERTGSQERGKKKSAKERKLEKKSFKEKKEEKKRLAKQRKEAKERKEEEGKKGGLSNPFNVFGAFFPGSKSATRAPGSKAAAATSEVEDRDPEYGDSTSHKQIEEALEEEMIETKKIRLVKLAPPKPENPTSATITTEEMLLVNNHYDDDDDGDEYETTTQEEEEEAQDVKQKARPARSDPPTEKVCPPSLSQDLLSAVLSSGGESALSDIEICRMVQSSMDRAKMASQEITDMLRDSPEKRRPVQEVAGIVQETMRRARESALGMDSSSPNTVSKLGIERSADERNASPPRFVRTETSAVSPSSPLKNHQEKEENVIAASEDAGMAVEEEVVEEIECTLSDTVRTAGVIDALLDEDTTKLEIATQDGENVKSRVKSASDAIDGIEVAVLASSESRDTKADPTEPTSRGASQSSTKENMTPVPSSEVAAHEATGPVPSSTVDERMPEVKEANTNEAVFDTMDEIGEAPQENSLSEDLEDERVPQPVDAPEPKDDAKATDTVLSPATRLLIMARDAPSTDDDCSAAASLRNKLSEKLSGSASATSSRRRSYSVPDSGNRAGGGKYSKLAKERANRRPKPLRTRSRSLSIEDDDEDAVITDEIVAQIAARKGAKITTDELAAILRTPSPQRQRREIRSAPTPPHEESFFSVSEDDTFVTKSEASRSDDSRYASGDGLQCGPGPIYTRGSSQESVGAEAQFCMDITDFFRQLDLYDAIGDGETDDDLSAGDTWTDAEATTFGGTTFEHTTVAETTEYETDNVSIEEDEDRRVTFSFSPGREDSRDRDDDDDDESSSDESSLKLW